MIPAGGVVRRRQKVRCMLSSGSHNIVGASSRISGIQVRLPLVESGALVHLLAGTIRCPTDPINKRSTPPPHTLSLSLSGAAQFAASSRKIYFRLRKNLGHENRSHEPQCLHKLAFSCTNESSATMFMSQLERICRSLVPFATDFVYKADGKLKKFPHRSAIFAEKKRTRNLVEQKTGKNVEWKSQSEGVCECVRPSSCPRVRNKNSIPSRSPESNSLSTPPIRTHKKGKSKICEKRIRSWRVCLCWWK